MSVSAPHRRHHYLCTLHIFILCVLHPQFPLFQKVYSFIPDFDLVFLNLFIFIHLSVYLLRAVTSGQTHLIGLKKLLGYKLAFSLVSTQI